MLLKHSEFKERKKEAKCVCVEGRKVNFRYARCEHSDKVFLTLLSSCSAFDGFSPVALQCKKKRRDKIGFLLDTFSYQKF